MELDSSEMSFSLFNINNFPPGPWITKTLAKVSFSSMYVYAWIKEIS
jgi:hypothetical protein